VRELRTFRDALCANDALRDRYEALKRNLAKAFRDDREAYAKAETAFIHNGLRQSGSSRIAGLDQICPTGPLDVVSRHVGYTPRRANQKERRECAAVRILGSHLLVGPWLGEDFH